MQLKVPTIIFIHLVERRNCEKLQKRFECVRMYVYTYIQMCLCSHSRKSEKLQESNSLNCHFFEPVCVCQFGVGIKVRSPAVGVTVTIQPLIEAHLRRRSKINKKN